MFWPPYDAEREGSSITEFYNVIREHQGDPDPKVQLFINCLLASADYDSFFNVLKKEAKKSLRKKRLGQESKPTVGEVDQSDEGNERNRSSSVPYTGEGKVEEERRHSDERSYK
ncbi:unnamed protein product [Laminaria digitata]